MSLTRWLALGGILVVLGLLLVVMRSPRDTDVERGRARVVSSDELASDRDRAHGATSRAREATAGADRATTAQDRTAALGALPPREQWRRQVGAAIRPIAVRLGRPLTPATEERVLDALATVGPAARGLDEGSLDPDDPASVARVREQTAALAAADRTCRDALGVGVMELLRMLDPGKVEDLGGEPPAG